MLHFKHNWALGEEDPDFLVGRIPVIAFSGRSTAANASMGFKSILGVARARVVVTEP